LRFIAAFCVVISHAIPMIVKYDAPPTILYLLFADLRRGHDAVLCSKRFCYFLNYSRSVGSGTEIWNFLVARFARLYPLFFVCAAFDLLMKLSFIRLSFAQITALPFYVTLAAIIGISLVSWTFTEVPCRLWIRDILTIKKSRAKQLHDIASEPAE
jgi:peptidoglycan/LPS O-acetylase OafA/YrhL